MLSKSQGQVLRVATAFHVLLCDPIDQQLATLISIPPTNSSAAIVAVQNFVETCCQHTTFIAKCGHLGREISCLSSGTSYLRFYILDCVRIMSTLRLQYVHTIRYLYNWV